MFGTVLQRSGLVPRVVGCLALLAVPVYSQPPATSAPRAPVPTQIVNGKKVFVANAGQDSYAIHRIVIFGGSPDRVYNEFYAALKEWGKYELVTAPADADLVFEIGVTLSDNGWRAPEIGRLHLAIRDPRTNVVLWTFLRHVPVALHQGNRDKNLGLALSDVVSRLKDLVTQSGTAAQ
ncbi:MAG: hypothetical protein JST11_28030 [Acidobacteria bacterium]|nr:hypothetical protein [Acidobacteriota bacterium]